MKQNNLWEYHSKILKEVKVFSSKWKLRKFIVWMHITRSLKVLQEQGQNAIKKLGSTHKK